MSASRDQTQKVAFVYSNLYQIYKKGKSAAILSGNPGPEPFGAAPKVEAYKPVEFLSKRVAPQVAPAQIPVAPPSSPRVEPIEGLRRNLESLSELHSRLKFMIQELEDLVK